MRSSLLPTLFRDVSRFFWCAIGALLTLGYGAQIIAWKCDPKLGCFYGPPLVILSFLIKPILIFTSCFFVWRALLLRRVPEEEGYRTFSRVAGALAGIGALAFMWIINPHG